MNAAWSVFLKYGYKRVTMADISDAAGISRPALYLVFSKKEEIFRAVVRHHGRQRLEEIRQGIASRKSPKDKLQFAFDVWTVQMFDSIMSSEEARELLDCSFKFAREAIEEGYAMLESVFVPILQPLIKGTSLRNLSAKQVAHVLTSSVRGFKQVSKDSAELGQMIDHLLTMTLANLDARLK